MKVQLTQREMRNWVRDHAKEITAEVNKSGIQSTIRKYSISGYYVQAALYLTGGTVPQDMLPRIKASFSAHRRASDAKKSTVRLDRRYSPEFRAMSYKERNEYIIRSAPKIAGDYAAGQTKSMLARKYGCGEYNVEVACYIMGMGTDVVSKGHVGIIKAWSEVKASIEADGGAAVTKAVVRPTDQVRTLIRELIREMRAKQWSDNDIKQVLSSTGKNCGWNNNDAPAIRAMLRLASTGIVKNPTPALTKPTPTQLTMTNDTVSEAVIIEKKYQELLKDVNENVAARVAADDAQAHKG